MKELYLEGGQSAPQNDEIYYWFQQVVSWKYLAWKYDASSAIPVTFFGDVCIEFYSVFAIGGWLNLNSLLKFKIL